MADDPDHDVRQGHELVARIPPRHPCGWLGTLRASPRPPLVVPVFVVVTLDGSSRFTQHLQSALLSKTLNDQRLSPLRAFSGLSHAPCGGAWARNTLASLRSVQSRITKTLLGFPPVVLATGRRAPPSALLLPLSRRETHQMSSSKRELVAMRAHVRQSDSSLSLDWRDDTLQQLRPVRLAGIRAVLRDQDSVLVLPGVLAAARTTSCTESVALARSASGSPCFLCKICCTMLFRQKSSCLTSWWHSCIFTLVHALRSVHFNSSDQSFSPPAFISLRTTVPARCWLGAFPQQEPLSSLSLLSLLSLVSLVSCLSCLSCLLSPLVSSCLLLSPLVSSCLLLSSLVFSCLVSSCLVFNLLLPSCLVSSSFVLSRLLLSCRRQFCLPRKAHVEFSLGPREVHQRNRWITHIFSLRTDRE